MGARDVGILSKGRGLAALAVSMACLAGPANALQADCLWSQLAPSKRDRLLESYHQEGPEALNHLDLSGEDLAGGVKACGLTEANSVRGGHLIGAKMVVLGSKRYFKETKGISAVTLDDAWAGLSAEPRAKLTRFAQQATLGQPTNSADMAPAFGLAQDLGLDLTVQGHQIQLVSFIFGKALLESWDGAQ